MADLTGESISSTYNTLLTTAGADISGSLQAIQDGRGNPSALKLSTSTVKVAGACVISSGSSDSALDILSTVTEPSAGGNPTIKINANNSTTKGLRFKAENAGGVIYAMQSGGVNALRFGYSTDDSDITESMQIDSAGRVGIGGTPSTRLEVINGAHGVTVNTGVQATFGSNEASSGINIVGTNTSQGRIYFGDPESSTTGRITYDHSNDSLGFATNGGTERMRIDSSGNVTVPTGNISSHTYGTATTGEGFRIGATEIYGQTSAADKVKISVNGDSYFNGGNVGIGRTPTTRELEVAGDILSVSTGTSAMIRIEAAGTQTTVGTAANSGAHLSLLNTTDTDDVFSRVDFLNSNEVSYAQIVGQATSQDDRKGELAFLTSDDAAPTEAMRITSDGNLEVFGDASFGANSYGALEQDSSTVRFRNTTTGEIHIMTHSGNEDINLNPAGYIQFETAGAEAMRITSDGHVILANVQEGDSDLASGTIYKDSSGFLKIVA